VTEKATFGAGCFWGVEVDFRNVQGVKDAAVGYMGGDVPGPTYEQVCTDRTGHAEVVQVEYDPNEVSYETLLRTFWDAHNPTRRNRQGPDVGSQYRSVIFFHTPEQQELALASKARTQARYTVPVVTEVEPAKEFWRAEERHQQYLVKHGRASCLT
jgi:peptide-methionine (S)-S-oxide reductase